jgi:hypothetical protein
MNKKVYVIDLPLAFFLKCLQIISDRLKCLPNRLGSVECLLSRLVTIHFLSVFNFICNVLCSQFGQYCASATLLVHWFMLASCISTDFLFSCCCCSCLLVHLVAVCTFGVLQPRLEPRHSWWTGCCLLLCSVDDVYCCLIRLCRVQVLWVQLGLLVLFNWVVVCFLLLFA